ncbi:hypothetical protein QBC47DRAFT_390276 [Echria macrotheca]|uniref:Uncharacterized protein n=1 Tax=Echria macrotheca TaxID=438768 RepID=A0AAJ0F8P1_9PEZI|nr:hypothetical protein QBC47DRAFT_390276 [Echria macrotheca]
MTDARNVAATGATVAATAAKASKLLSSAVQLMGDAPSDVQQALTQVQAVSSSVSRLTEQLQQSCPTAPEWAGTWLGEVSRIVDATATEINALHALLARWDQLRSGGGSSAQTLSGFRGVISSDQLAQATRRAEVAKSAVLLLTSAAQLSSTPAVNALIDQARNKTSSLLSDQSSDPPNAPPPPAALTRATSPVPAGHIAHVHHNGAVMANGMMMGTAMVNGGYTMAPYQSPPLSPPEQPPPYEQTSSTFPIRPTNRASHPHQQVGYFLVSVAAHAQQEAGITALRQELATRTRRVAELEAEVSELRGQRDGDIAEIVTLKDEVLTRDRRIAELEAESAEFRTLQRRSSTASNDNQDQVFKDLVSKYKGVKKLYFEARGEISTLNRQVAELKKTSGSGGVSSSSKAVASTSASSPVSPTDLVGDENESGSDGGKEKEKAAAAAEADEWRQRFEELSARVRAQDDADAEMIREWREKYDTLMAQHLSLEDVARTAEELRGEIERLRQELEVAEDKLRHQADEIAASHKALSDAQRMLEDNDQVYGAKVAALEHDREVIRGELEARLAAAEAERASQVEDGRNQLQAERSQLEAERVEKMKALEAVKRLSALWQEAQKVVNESGLES